MASSYSTDLKLELMVTGENSGTWGDKTNTNLNLIQQAVSGYQAVSIAGGAQTTTLAMSNATLSNARNMVINFTGAITGNQIVQIPDGLAKYYILKNSTTGAFTVTFKTQSGTGITLTQGKLTACYSDGTNINTVDLTTLQGTISGSQIASSTITSSNIANNAITNALLDTNSVKSYNISANAVGSTQLDTASVTSFKIAAGAVGPTQLSNTAVTAGTYTTTTLQVDAQGRIVYAASGAASGSGMEIAAFYSATPGSSTYSSNPKASKLLLYAKGGGGTGGHASYHGAAGTPGGIGGAGGFGVWAATSNAGSFTTPYTIAGGGQSTTVPGFSATAGAGGGGPGGNGPRGTGYGSPGTSTGSLFNYSGLITQGGGVVYPFIANLTYGQQGSGSGGAGGDGVPDGNPAQQGTPGGPGSIAIYDNSGAT